MLLKQHQERVQGCTLGHVGPMGGGGLAFAYSVQVGHPPVPWSIQHKAEEATHHLCIVSFLQTISVVAGFRWAECDCICEHQN